MSVNNREKDRGWDGYKKNFKVQVSHVSDASTDLHEENVYLALIVCNVCLLRYLNVYL